MIKVGLLLDSFTVPLWTNQFIDAIQKDERFTICIIILNDTAKKNKSLAAQLKTAGYRLLRSFDKKVMSVTDNPFKRGKISSNTIHTLKVKPVQKKYTDRFSKEAIDEIKNFKPDVILRFGFRILKGDILTAATHGIISLHHGDTDFYRGGPPAFWEVVNKEPVTGVTVQQLTENLDGGFILEKAFLKTDTTSFYRNQVKIYWAGKELMLSVLKKMAELGAEKYFLNKQVTSVEKIYSSPLYRNPGNFNSIVIFINWAVLSVGRKFINFLFPLHWQIIYSFNKTDVFQKSFFRFKYLKPPKNTEWADPFVISKRDGYYVFFEEKYFHKQEAHISFIEFNIKGELVSGQPTIALKEEHHLSYPYIFVYNGEHYMIPESASVNQVWLYKAAAFPQKWQKVKCLLENIRVYDATLCFHNGKWFLFGNSKSEDNLSSDAYLHIFYSGDLLNESFKPHPVNPVYRDVRHSRPAGKIFEWDGKLIRPAQISAPRYGYGISFRNITKLSETEFEEVQTDTVNPDWHKKIKGIHTITIEGNFVVADILTHRFRWS